MDGILGHESSVNVAALHVDGGGASDIVFAVMHLLGLSFEPRIPRLSDRKLYAFEPKARYGTLAPLFGHRPDAGLIRTHWEDAQVLMCIGYFQPITRAELSSFFGKEISRDLIGHLRGAKLIASGPRSPTPGAPYTYVTTKEFLLEFGFDTLRDLPDFEALEDAGLLSKDKLLAGEILLPPSDEDDKEQTDDDGSEHARA